MTGCGRSKSSKTAAARSEPGRLLTGQEARPLRGRHYLRTVTQIENLQAHGIRRKGTQKSGFRFVHANGKPVTAEELKRIHKLRLPPAWKDVAISASPTAKLQAVGKDVAG